jgi:NADH-quinone oxidoreductase subunit M
MLVLVPLVVLVFWIGVFPNPILTRMHASIDKVIARVSPSSPEPALAVGLDPLAALVRDTAPAVEQVGRP